MYYKGYTYPLKQQTIDVIFKDILKSYDGTLTDEEIETILEESIYSSKISGLIATRTTYKEYLQTIGDTVQISTFDYYYQRMKKMTLLRMYQKAGMDISWLYDPDNILNVKKKEYQENWLDSTPIEEIADIIDKKITDIRLKYVDDTNSDFVQAGDGVIELIEKLQKNPEVGYPMFGPLINTITRGARLKKFYLRSAGTGIGKTRSMIADACYISCSKIYDENFGWIKCGTQEPVLFVTTEQELEEIQTMMLAFLSNVNEEHILNGEYLEGEEKRIDEAIKILEEAPLYVEELPDFSL